MVRTTLALFLLTLIQNFAIAKDKVNISGVLERIKDKKSGQVTLTIREVSIEGSKSNNRVYKLRFPAGIPESLGDLKDGSLIRIFGDEITTGELTPNVDAGDVQIIAPLEHEAQFVIQAVKMVAKAATKKAHAAPIVPAFSSNPTAKAKIHLDFDGNYAATWGGWTNVTTPVFDQDGDPSSFSEGERASIEMVWRRVAEDYAPFNIDVTTIDPGNLTNKVTAKIPIGGSASDWFGQSAGGVAYVGGFSNTADNIGFVFANNLQNNERYIAEAASHEAGHLFGLNHVGCNGATYCSDIGNGRAPIMGVGYYASRTIFWNQTQDDFGVISGAANGFGYRADDIGNTSSGAIPMQVSNYGSTVSGKGLIGQTSDVDVFSFSAGAGPANFTLYIPENVVGNLDAIIELRDSAGQLIAVSDVSPVLNVDIPSGNYRLFVKSRGNYGDAGSYQVYGSISPSGAINPPSNFAASLQPYGIDLSWQENNITETGIELERSVDGAAFVRIASLAANSLSYGDTDIAPGHRFSYRVRSVKNAEVSDWTSVSAYSLPLTPQNVIASGISSTQIRVSWDSAGGAEEYLVERSSDGANFSSIGSFAGVLSYTDSYLAPSSKHYYRISARNPSGTSAASAIVSAVTLEGALPPSAPSSLALALASKQVSLSWQDNSSNEANFVLERSSNGGKSFQVIATLPANTIRYTDGGVAGGKSYHYRVKATNAGGSSAYSNYALVSVPRK